jgi:hypothetical protein
MRVIGRLRSLNHELFGSVAIERFRSDSKIECRLCDMRWLVFLAEHSEYRIIAEHGPPRRLTTPLGTDKMKRGRRGALVQTSAAIELEQTWTEWSECLWERTTVKTTSISASGKAKAGPIHLGGEVQRLIENSIRSTLSSSSGTQQTFRQTIEIPIPAGTVATIIINWEQIWEEVDCEVRITDDQTVIVPFRRAVGVIFHDDVRHEYE